MASSKNADSVLLLICGLPASGKSTLSELISKNFDNFLKLHLTVRDNLSKGNLIFYHICFDDYLENLPFHPEDEDHSDYKSARDKLRATVEHCLDLYRADFDNSSLNQIEKRSLYHNLVDKFLHQVKPQRREDSALVLLLDDNFYYISMRYEYFQLARRLSCGFGIVWIETDIESSLNFNRSRKSSVAVSEDTILRMAEKLQRPKAQTANNCENMDSEYSDLAKSTFEHTLCQISREQLSALISQAESTNFGVFSEIWRVIHCALVNPILPKDTEDDSERNRQINQKNLVHQCDILLRKIIGEYIRENRHKPTDNTIRVFSYQELNARKSKLVEQISRSNADVQFLKAIFEDCLTTCDTSTLYMALRQKLLEIPQ